MTGKNENGLLAVPLAELVREQARWWLDRPIFIRCSCSFSSFTARLVKPSDATSSGSSSLHCLLRSLRMSCVDMCRLSTPTNLSFLTVFPLKSYKTEQHRYCGLLLRHYIALFRRLACFQTCLQWRLQHLFSIADQEAAKNYWPILLLSTVSKVRESFSRNISEQEKK